MASSRLVQWTDIDLGFKKLPNGEIKIVRDTNAIDQSIKILLSTLRGTRVRTDLGSGLYNVLFQPISEQTAEEISDIVEFAIIKYEPRVILNSVQAFPIPELNFYRLLVDYTIIPSQRRKRLETFIPSMAGEDF